ncbi:hypothetical protein [Shewanella saliphila]|uniref:Uncharacterized protein n=1 Tax=Shewanella saliphila TaxID=2282698 RepID=A0ABQ2Q3U0_9GAMM|nr:hypothetical protein [Shewanella saliphila]MCL1101213.1 hypothetical protein [Shewanella saliphila]GGP48074.1 hypothetical protein GCM10009409_13410 [Shewanella saliphila]
MTDLNVDAHEMLQASKRQSQLRISVGFLSSISAKQSSMSHNKNANQTIGIYLRKVYLDNFYLS